MMEENRTELPLWPAGTETFPAIREFASTPLSVCVPRHAAAYETCKRAGDSPNGHDLVIMRARLG